MAKLTKFDRAKLNAPPAGYHRVELKVGKVMLGASQKRSSGWHWYTWPSDINALEAELNSVLFGPFSDEATARTAAGKAELLVRSEGEDDLWTGCQHLDCTSECSLREPYRCGPYERWHSERFLINMPQERE